MKWSPTALVAVFLLFASGSAHAATSFQPQLGTPASNVQVIGASPGEAAGEAWAQGELGAVPAASAPGTPAGSQVLLRYTAAAGSWQVVPVDSGEGQPLPFSWWGSEATAGGGVVLAGAERDAGGATPASAQTLVTRDPGGAFAVAPLPASSGPTAVLAPEEALFPAAASTARPTTAPLLAALDEGNGQTGALVAPVWSEKAVPAGELGRPGILHFDGTTWTREPICAELEANGCVAAEAGLRPLALAASSPGQAFLLASGAGGAIKLFQRVRVSGLAAPLTTPAWVPVTFASGLLATGGVPAGESLAAPPGGPLLTVTNQGTWVDLALSGGVASGDATMLVAGAQGEPPLGVDAGSVLGTWCYPTSLCPVGTPSLGATLPSDYGSFAWPGSGASPGTRVITGLPNGALLELAEGGGFSYVVGGGAGGAGTSIGPGGATLGLLPGEPGTPPSGGAAFDSPTEGWLGGSEPLLHVTGTPASDQLTAWPVPFRRPLLAAATQPGTTAGAAGAEALAVGAEGAVARYQPGQGWDGEYLYNAAGERQTPNLRGVAWPEPERAFAVGDNGAMWVWQEDTDTWEADPAAPLGFRGQLTAIAFSPQHPEVGYAVGKQGVLLGYGKTWTQETLPEGLANANFTSVAFAGEEAIASYRMPSPTPSNPYQDVGGLIVNVGSGWQRDPAADALLAQLPAKDTVLSRVAGLPDGGAVAAGPGVVIERDGGAGTPWRFSGSPLPEAEDVSALAAFREGSSVRALVSLAVATRGQLEWGEIDNPPSPAQGAYGNLLPPDPLPSTGYVVRETASGWRDEEGEAYPVPAGLSENGQLPGWPDPVFALLAEPGGGSGWAVGGQSGGGYYEPEFGKSQIETANVSRFGAGASPPQQAEAPLTVPAGTATFALGGDAQCTSACADFANQRLGADTWLTAAIARADGIAGLHDFLYTGQRLPVGAASQGEGPFDRELGRYAELLGDGTLPVYAASSPSDLTSSGLGAFTAALGGHVPAGTVPPGTPVPPNGEAAYAFESAGAGGAVRVIVLDYSGSVLAAGDTAQSGCATNPETPTNQLQWLCSQLYYASRAGVPAIVLGNANVSSSAAANYAADAAAVDRVLLGAESSPGLPAAGASAYLFDSPGRNVKQQIGSGSETIPAFGSGTLGYVAYPLNGSKEFFGANGFLMVSVETGGHAGPENRTPVTATLVPNVGRLGLEATNGTLLRRSSVGLFSGLARIPEGGAALQGNPNGAIIQEFPEPYVPIPEHCLGSGCAQFIAPQYTFTSSDPEVGNFVAADPNSTNPRAVEQVNGKPVADPSSGLFCAFNAGTTTVTLTAGGLSTSMPVTVQAGSVAQPCGTVPLKNPPAAVATPEAATGEVPPPAPAPAPAPEPQPALPPAPAKPVTPVPAPTPPAPAPTPRAPAPVPATVLPVLTPAVIPPRAVVPPPGTQPPEPTPPSGTSQVTQPVGITEEEKEEEPAIEAAHHMSARRHGDPGRLIPGLTLILVLAAAGVGVGMGKQRRGRIYDWAATEGSSDPGDR
jgi:hypothetical protein